MIDNPLRVSKKGKEKLLATIRLHLNDTSVPQDGKEHMLLYWITGLLENVHRDELRQDLEEP